MSPHPVGAGEVLPLTRTLDTDADPLTLFRSLCDEGLRTGTLLLESGDTSLEQGEKSLLVSRAAVRARCWGRSVELEALTLNGEDLLDHLARPLSTGAKVERLERALRVSYPPASTGDEEERLHAPSPLDALRSLACGATVLSNQTVAFPLVAGVFAFDLIGCFETLPEPRGEGSDWPDFELWLPDQMIWFHHRKRTATIVAQVYGGRHAERSYNDATQAVAKLSNAIAHAWTSNSVCAASLSNDQESRQDRVARAAASDTPTHVTREQSHGEASIPGRRLAQGEASSLSAVPGPKPMLDGDFVTDLDDAGYCALVSKLKEHIVAGDVFQIVPSRSFFAPCSDPIEAYRTLRKLNPSPYMFVVNGSAGTLFGASPETAVKVVGTPRDIEIRPIAGTRPRGRKADGNLDADLDARIEAELRLDEKELAEHMMLVDLARNDVARVSEPGTRAVSRLLDVVRYSHVMHLVTHVRGRLRAALDGLHAYQATMNMGTLTGAPKLKAAELLRLYEPGRRGPYGGAVGYLTSDGCMDTSIVIRSAVVRDGVARVRAGAGVVFDSEPMAEAMETRRKAEAVLRAIHATEAGKGSAAGATGVEGPSTAAVDGVGR